MIISLIVAYDLAGGIGAGNRIPWRLPSDQRRFKKVTMGHHIIMGRKTWDSIGRPLPGRQSIIITHQKGLSITGADIVHSLEEAINLARQRNEDECFVIGGGAIYTQAFALANRIYATEVQTIIPFADVFFLPPINQEWHEVINEQIKEPGDDYAYHYKILETKIPPHK